VGSGWIQTINGPVSVESLGLSLPHEHLFTDLRGPGAPGYAEADSDDVVRAMSPYLAEASDVGVTLLVECTPPGVGRNIGMLRRLAETTPIHIVAATGAYREAFLTAAIRDMPLEAVVHLWTGELTEGIEGTSSRAGFIKLAVSDDGITALEARNLRAAALTSQRTGAVIASHTRGGKLAHEEMDLLEAAGLTLERFIWVHAQNEPDHAVHAEVARRGAWVELDAIGAEGRLEIHLEATLALLEAGYVDHILLSHDAGWYQPGQPGGLPFSQGRRGYTALVDQFLPALRARGVTEEMVRRLTVTNPARAFVVNAPSPGNPD
jgi:phosphotriesterase-related protein